jgi:hypothetical protein
MNVEWVEQGIIGSDTFVEEHLAPMCRDFAAKAEIARKTGVRLLVPVSAQMDEEALMRLIRGDGIVGSNGNDGTEPVYLSLEEANAGSNLDETAHDGYLVIKPDTLRITNMVDRNGQTKLSFTESAAAEQPDSPDGEPQQFTSSLPLAKVAGGTGSLSACPYSVLVALDAFEQKLGRGRKWKPVNRQQDALLNWRQQCGADLPRLGDAVKGMCSQDAGALNKFLADNGFNIRLSPLGKDDLGAVGILDLLVEWLNAGDKQSIRCKDGKIAEGVRIKDAEVLDLNGSDCAVRLETKDGTRVYIMPSPRPADQFQLMGRVMTANAEAGKARRSEEYKGCDFPMVDMLVQEDVSWLRGMCTVGQDNSPWTVTQAMQENRLRMNQFGARAQSATAMVVTRGISFEQPFVVDEPFIVWFTKPNCTRPLFAAWVDYSDWRNPGDLKAK